MLSELERQNEMDITQNKFWLLKDKYSRICNRYKIYMDSIYAKRKLLEWFFDQDNIDRNFVDKFFDALHDGICANKHCILFKLEEDKINFNCNKFFENKLKRALSMYGFNISYIHKDDLIDIIGVYY